jgi:hypothetical protein
MAGRLAVLVSVAFGRHAWGPGRAAPKPNDPAACAAARIVTTRRLSRLLRVRLATPGVPSHAWACPGNLLLTRGCQGPHGMQCRVGLATHAPRSQPSLLPPTPATAVQSMRVLFRTFGPKRAGGGSVGPPSSALPLPCDTTRVGPPSRASDTRYQIVTSLRHRTAEALSAIGANKRGS